MLMLIIKGIARQVHNVQISIHLMLMLIEFDAPYSHKAENFNTSHVNVNPNIQYHF